MTRRPVLEGQREELSEREKDILKLVASGASNKEIGATLDISANTVKVHLRNVFAKLDVRSRTEASMAAIELGLLPAPGQPPQVEPQPAEQVLAAAEPAERREPVRWWQRLVVLAAIVVAALAAFIPSEALRPRAGSRPDPLSDAGITSTGQDSLGRWRELAQMPSARARFAAALVGRTIVAIGGDADSGATGSVELYDIDRNTWRLGRTKPTAVSNAGAAVIGGLVYVPGGYSADGEVLDRLEIYDPATDSWSSGPRLPQPLCAYAIASDGQRLYLFGGWDGSAYLNVAISFSPESGEWLVLPSMPYARGHAAAAVLGGRVYVVGGYDGGRSLSRVDVFDPQGENGGAWSPGPALTEPRAGLALVTVSDSLYAVGGGWDESVRYGESLAQDAAQWRRWDAPTVGRWRNLGAAADTSSIYALGGWNEEPLAKVYGYQVVYRIMIPLAR